MTTPAKDTPPAGSASAKDTPPAGSASTEDKPDTEPGPAVPGGNPGKVRADIDPDAAPEDPRDWGVHYSRAGQVRQALGELRNARGQGNTTREHAALKMLHSLGYDPKPGGNEPSTTGDKSVDARKQPPEGRSATPPSRITTASAPSSGVSATSSPPSSESSSQSTKTSDQVGSSTPAPPAAPSSPPAPNSPPSPPPTGKPTK